MCRVLPALQDEDSNEDDGASSGKKAKAEEISDD